MRACPRAQCEAGRGSHPPPARAQAAPTAAPETESQAKRRRLKCDKLRAKHLTRTLANERVAGSLQRWLAQARVNFQEELCAQLDATIRSFSEGVERKIQAPLALRATQLPTLALRRGGPAADPAAGHL